MASSLARRAVLTPIAGRWLALPKSQHDRAVRAVLDLVIALALQTAAQLTSLWSALTRRVQRRS